MVGKYISKPVNKISSRILKVNKINNSIFMTFYLLWWIVIILYLPKAWYEWMFNILYICTLFERNVKSLWLVKVTLHNCFIKFYTVGLWEIWREVRWRLWINLVWIFLLSWFFNFFTCPSLFENCSKTVFFCMIFMVSLREVTNLLKDGFFFS